MAMIRAVKRGRDAVQVLARQRADGTSTSAPVKGWNARDNIANMKSDEALILDNWYPERERVRVRRGFDGHLTGLPGPVESLMAWAAGGTSRMFAASDGGIYDASSAGAVGAAVHSGLSGNRWQHVNFGTAGGNFLYLVNGEDDPLHYDGSTWTAPTISGSGLTPADLIHVNTFKRRLFLIEKDTLSFWYFPVVTISGAIVEFKLDALCDLGGHLMAMGNWTMDGGDGLDDLAVFVTSKGEVILFQGTDPGDAENWSMVGRYRIGAPIGRRCLMKDGGDLIIVTEDGFVPLSKVLKGRGNEGMAISDAITGAVSDAVRAHRSKFGWQPILYPAGGMAIFNVPIIENSTAYQFVRNTTTGAWCRFKGQNANCWEVFNDEVYFGGADAVYMADTGLSDDGADIETDVKTAFSYFGSRGQLKRFPEVRPLLATDGQVSVALDVNVDFEDRVPTATPAFTPAGGAEWDMEDWDEADWGDFERIFKDWQTVSGLGYCAALRMKTASRQGAIYWSSTDWIIERARGLI